MFLDISVGSKVRDLIMNQMYFFFNCHLTFNKMLKRTGGGVRGINPVSRLTGSLWIRQEAARLRNTPTCNCTIRRARNLLARLLFLLRI